MRSKNSFFDWTIYKKTVLRFWPLWTGYFAIWLISLPLEGLMELRRRAENGSNLIDYMERFSNLTVPQTVHASLYLALFFGGLAAMAVFSHLYNARSANLFGSLPIRREGLFLTHYLAGLSFLIMPNVIICLLTLIVEAVGGCVVTQGLGFWLGVTCGECFFFYSMAVFCGMFTGHILAMPAFYGICNILAYGVMMLVRTMLGQFYYGFAGFSDAVGDAVEWLTPLNALSHKVGSFWNAPAVMSPEGVWVDGEEWVLGTYGLDAAGVYVLAGLALAACAFFLYRARRLESAGDVVAVQPMKPVFKYGVALCAGMALGVYTTYAISGGEFTLMAAILIWGVIGCFAAQMLLDKSFRVFKKWKGPAAVAGVFVVVFLVVGLDLTGFETRVPDPADVASVELEGLGGVNLDDSGDYVYGLEVTDPTQIAQLIAVHQAAVDERGRDTTGTYTMSRLKMKYTLNNGSTMSREYWMCIFQDEVDREGASAWAMERLYQNKDLFWRVYGFDELERSITEEGGRLESAELGHYYNEWEYNHASFVVGYGSDARALLDAVEEDFRAGRIGVRTFVGIADQGNRGTQYTDYGGGQHVVAEAMPYNPPDTLTFRVVDPDSIGGSLCRVEVALQETATSTMRTLEELAEKMEQGSERRMLEEQLQKMYKELEELEKAGVES